MASKKTTKHYYWLKLKDTFFNQLEIKKLRRMAGGDTYTIIYLKLQLLSIKSGGFIEFRHIENDLVDELALLLDEEVDNIRATLVFLQNLDLIAESDIDCFFLPEAAANIGKETESAERMRKHREEKRNRSSSQQDFAVPSHCDTRVTRLLQESAISVTLYDSQKSTKNGDILGVSQCDEKMTIEKEIEIEKDINEDDKGDYHANIFEKLCVQNFQNSINNFAEQILLSLGKDREPTYYELALLEKWLIDWEMSEDLILFVLPRTVTADNPSFQYVNAILEDLIQHKIHSVDAARAYYRNRDMARRLDRTLRWGIENYDEDKQ